MKFRTRQLRMHYIHLQPIRNAEIFAKPPRICWMYIGCHKPMLSQTFKRCLTVTDNNLNQHWSDVQVLSFRQGFLSLKGANTFLLVQEYLYMMHPDYEGSFKSPYPQRSFISTTRVEVRSAIDELIKFQLIWNIYVWMRILSSKNMKGGISSKTFEFIFFTQGKLNLQVCLIYFHV